MHPIHHIMQNLIISDKLLRLCLREASNYIHTINSMPCFSIVPPHSYRFGKSKVDRIIQKEIDGQKASFSIISEKRILCKIEDSEFYLDNILNIIPSSGKIFENFLFLDQKVKVAEEDLKNSLRNSEAFKKDFKSKLGKKFESFSNHQICFVQSCMPKPVPQIYHRVGRYFVFEIEPLDGPKEIKIFI
eukprot:GHVP01006036.1.p1 GENE.GHVP01006036.1~~GHVP01006036.1.p1  ORF type:complete len:188 (+),score=27.02 GHVP01006036.1:285-848(+)